MLGVGSTGEIGMRRKQMMKKANTLSLADTIRIGTAVVNIETIHRCKDDKVQLTVIPVRMPFDFWTVNLEPWQEIEVIEQ